ncbi:Protein involved in the inositol acylation of glucosaminyl phosphatidylinositol (GlcN-PI) [Ogataea parapolymorpha DL-1]|uniref:GPI-anchored wall transfer protein 1 n=1 Tax=Ogataea parapolymorpha (strain ATCC 26012 / BCRC 20466 / JCM 22074 / NRRL Y-7560 / DL-1) TaxID=871575 RepID=W1QEG3_OGAPD|nr:Protein involved in the inositol acylation of glucosaminyl phosphatidylinositol (GlcN-PI) [Ogataea parapolymorpha DL-1]ESW99376.1 Protein involved in the inositol acylation of glucosaminyl phosphatidylinositol (GlcN-PI) [Ogataea parapolymorpha DL-1]
MGLVSARQNIRQRFDSNYSYVKNLITSIKNSIPLLILGAIRLSSVKTFDYQEHITEYGKHWNFFFTLSLLPLIANGFAPIIDLLSPIVTGFLIMLLYEVVLTKLGLLEYILNSQREGLIGMNKEGLFSLAGYLAIYLNGISLGYTILPLFPTRENLLRVSGSKDECLNNRKIHAFSVSPTKGLFILATLFHALYYVLDTCYLYGVSRRMANSLYVIWVCAYNYTFLFGYKLVENLVWGEPRYELTHSETRITVVNDYRDMNCVPVCLRAVNYNGLTIFILANVLTGLVNLTFNTIDTSDTIALIILIAYCAVLSTVAFFLYTRKIHIR